MKAQYEDITSRIPEQPTWYDMNGVPRYGPFQPKACPNIYSHQIALMRIACQYCHRPFDVEIHDDGFFHQLGQPKKLHYGDPPIHDCVGDTMNCEDLAVLEVWSRDTADRLEWVRLPELEGLIA